MFVNSNMFGTKQYTEHELSQLAKLANEGVDQDKFNKVLKEQMKKELLKEIGFLNGQIKIIDEEIKAWQDKIDFYEKRLTTAKLDEQIERYEKTIFELEKAINLKKNEKEEYKKEIAQINKNL